MYEQQSLLSDDIDYKATEKNVKHFLTRIYPRAKRMAGKELATIKSPQITDMPKGAPAGNLLEQRLIQRAYAQQVVKATVNAIYRCDAFSREVLDLLYLQGYSDSACYMAIGYQRSQYFKRIKPKALRQFAEAYELEDLEIHRWKQKIWKTDSKRTENGLRADYDRTHST